MIVMERRRVRSWHGLEFTIELQNGWAKIGFFFHPQLANFFMRYGLPEKDRVEMEILHELGHIQMFPFVLAYYIPFYLSGISGGFEIGIATAGMFLFWEVLAEAYVFFKYRTYIEVYRKSIHPITLAFWAGIFVAVLVPLIVLILLSPA
jgi:hypothetical protein